MSRCQYCWYPQEVVEKHHMGCPLDGGSMRDWEEGANAGFNFGWGDISLPRTPSKSFLLGFRVGENDIECQIEAAAETEFYAGPRVEY